MDLDNIYFTKFEPETNWCDGMINDWHFQAKLFDTGSQFGINDGRVSKLAIWKETFRDCIVHYDRGWDVKPATPEHQKIFNDVLFFLEMAPKRFS